MNIKINNKGSGWVGGKCGNYDFEAKVYNKGSKFGINDGRVSKLAIIDYDENNKWVMNYDRDWDIEPEGEVVDVYANIIEVLENYKKEKI